MGAIDRCSVGTKLVLAPQSALDRDLDKLQTTMTSQDFKQTIAAFAVERQVLAPELARSIEDKQTIAAGLLLCLSFLVGQTISDLQIEQLDRIYPAGRNQGLIDFKIVCRLPTQVQVNLGVCVLTSSDFATISDACNRLLVYKDFGLDRLCLLRHGDLSADTYLFPESLPKLLSPDIGGHFIQLKSIDLLTILTTLSVFQHREQHQVTREMLAEYLHKRGLLSRNELIKGILATAHS